MELLGYAKKLAHRHAYENAFKRVIIISLDNGKVGVEINMQDIPECSLDESGEEGIVQINYLEEMLFSDSEDEKNSEIEFQDTSNTLLDTHVIDVSSWNFIVFSQCHEPFTFYPNELPIQNISLQDQYYCSRQVTLIIIIIIIIIIKQLGNN